MAGLPEDVRENWEKCKSGPLAEINKRNLCDLVSLQLSSDWFFKNDAISLRVRKSLCRSTVLSV